MSCAGWSRRKFLKLVPAATVATLPLGLAGCAGRNKDIVLLPPGATADFFARCIRCGKCLEACPYDVIRLHGVSSGALVHTPYVDPLRTPCYLCQHRGEDGKDRPVSKYLRCGEACPSGALRKVFNDKEVLAEVPRDVTMGVSRIDRRLCLAWQYDACGECYYNCPLKDKAIRDRPPEGEAAGGGAGIRPWVDPDHCIGCGMCNYVCPVNEKIARMQFVKGRHQDAFEVRYASMVRNVLGRAGRNRKLPAVRVHRRS